MHLAGNCFGARAHEPDALVNSHPLFARDELRALADYLGEITASPPPFGPEFSALFSRPRLFLPHLFVFMRFSSIAFGLRIV